MGVDPWVDSGIFSPTFRSGGEALCFVPLYLFVLYQVMWRVNRQLYFFVNVLSKLLSPEAFSTPNALNIVWRPGSVRTRLGSL